eukprot:TRINITY_DN6265_c0_g1_i2.p1 TRINITY_DN6265_c0_g1~~TRINITY_DN6265_c0_g1_i2.p1  ORF type:complete len:408 (+),score=66.76 TRINITY_DN6265_c0_g1_i2:2-1225(+)
MGNQHHKSNSSGTRQNNSARLPVTIETQNLQAEKKMDNTEAWQVLVGARAADIRKWLSQQRDVQKALTTEVLNQQTAMQLVVGGRMNPTSEAIIESLKVLIEHGADVNYIPPESSEVRQLMRDPVPYLAAINCEPAVLQFLFEKGADFTLRHPSSHMAQRAILSQCSFMNAFTLQKLLDPAVSQHTLSFKHSNHPAKYNHELALMKLDWVHYISDGQLKTTLLNVLQSRVISAFKVEPERGDREYGSNQKTEITFDLQLNSSDATLTPVTLVYSTDISCNGSEMFELVLTMARDQHGGERVSVKLTHDLNAFHGNDLIPDQRAEGFDEFVQSLSDAMHVTASPDLGYLFIVLLLCHVDDMTLVRRRGYQSNRSRVLRPAILGSLPIPPAVAQLGRDWARAEDLKRGY